MTPPLLSLALVLLVRGAAADPGPVRMVVADLPYARVWGAAREALREYPIEQLVEGEIVTGWPGPLVPRKRISSWHQVPPVAVSTIASRIFRTYWMT